MLMSPRASCYFLDALRIYTRNPCTAETSQYPAGTEYIGMAEYLILHVFNPLLLVLQRFAVLTYMSFNRVSISFHRGDQSVSQVTTVLPVTATPACSGGVLVKQYPKMTATEVTQSRCSNSLVLS